MGCRWGCAVNTLNMNENKDIIIPEPPPGGYSKDKFRGFTSRQRAYRNNRLKGMNQYNAARAAGYSHATAQKNGGRLERQGRAGLKDLMEQAGFTDKFIIDYINQGLKATRLFGAEATEHADWVAREKFFARLLELEEKIVKPGVNVHVDNSKHVTYVLSDRMKEARERLNRVQNADTISTAK